MYLLKSLEHRPFALLWGGQTTSRLGDSLYRIAMAWWVLEKTGSAEAMGSVLIFSSVPMLIFLLIGGVVTDRLPRLRVMLTSDLLSGSIVAIIAFLAFTGWLEVWHIYIASIIFGLVQAFFFPAYTATVPEITPVELLPSANSMTSLGQRAASIIGPTFAAAVVASGGTSLAFGLDALTFFISAACIVPIFKSNPDLAKMPAAVNQGVGTATSPAPLGLKTVFTDVREGLGAVIGSPWLWITIAIFSLVNATSSAPMSVSLPFLIKVNLNKEVDTLGLITSMSSVGFVVGALLLGRLRRIRRRGPLAYLATLLSGISVAVFGLTNNILVLAASAFLGGLFMSLFGLIWINSLQELVPRHLLGRVASIDALGSFVLLPIGYAVAGWATDIAGAPMVFAIGGATTVILALVGLSHPAIRGLD
ncbi:MAG: MFS transporter [Bellilinea sp.]